MLKTVMRMLTMSMMMMIMRLMTVMMVTMMILLLMITTSCNLACCGLPQAASRRQHPANCSGHSPTMPPVVPRPR